MALVDDVTWQQFVTESLKSLHQESQKQTFRHLPLHDKADKPYLVNKIIDLICFGNFNTHQLAELQKVRQQIKHKVDPCKTCSLLLRWLAKEVKILMTKRFIFN